MINYVFAAEFDILKGSCIEGIFPDMQSAFNESLLGAYMIPDGIHKREKDSLFFKFIFKNNTNQLFRKIEKINSMQIKTKLCKYEEKTEKWEPLQEENIFNILHIYIKNGRDVSEIRLKQQENHENCFQFLHKLEIHKDLQLAKLTDKFFSLYSKDGESYGILFDSTQDFETVFAVIKQVENELNFYNKNEKNTKDILCYFFNVVKNKRDTSIKRGSLIRAISICSSNIKCLSIFEDVLEYYIDLYTEFPIKAKRKENLKELLESLYNKLTNTIIQIPYSDLTIPEEPLLYVPLEFEENPEKNIIQIDLPSSIFEGFDKKLEKKENYQKKLNLQYTETYFKNFTNASLLDFVKKFKEKTMVIYNAIMKENRIIFINNENSIEELINYVNGCILLAYPINISHLVYPFEHLLNLDFLYTEGFIAGVSNPIFASHKVLTFKILYLIGMVGFML